MDNRPIGIFDSGVGGLTVVKEVFKQLPEEEIVYFGDTKRVPYGNKTKEELLRFATEIIFFLQTKNVKMIIVACNTICSQCLDIVEVSADIPLIGVVKPGAKAGINASVNQKIGVIATEGTVRSGAYERNMKGINNTASVYSKACPNLVTLTENGQINNEAAFDVCKQYLSYFHDREIDTLVLGCTHYPLLEEPIKSALNDKITIVDPAIETVSEAVVWLDHNQKRNEGIQKELPKHQFYVSKDAAHFTKMSNLALGRHYEASVHSL